MSGDGGDCTSGGGEKKRATCCAWLCLSAAELVYTLPKRMGFFLLFFFFAHVRRVKGACGGRRGLGRR